MVLQATSEETCVITNYALSGSQVWGVAITAGAMVGLVLLTGWWLLEKIQDWWYDRQNEPSEADITAVDPMSVEPYTPSIDKHMQVAKELIEDVEGSQVSSYGDDEEGNPSKEG